MVSDTLEHNSYIDKHIHKYIEIATCPSSRPWRRIVRLPSSANGRFSVELPLPPELGWGEDGG